MVKKIQFEEVGTKNYPRKACVVTLFTGKKIEFTDKDGIYDLFVSYQALGDKDFIKSVRLVEEEKKVENSVDFDMDDDVKSNTFFCVLYELKNGQAYRLFASKKFAKQMIINYYDLFKRQQAEQKKVAPAQK